MPFSSTAIEGDDAVFEESAEVLFLVNVTLSYSLLTNSDQVDVDVTFSQVESHI